MFLSGGGVNLQSHRRPGRVKPLPSETHLACLLCDGHLRGGPENNRGRLKALRRAQYSVKNIVGGYEAQVDRFPFFLGERKCARKHELLIGSEELLGDQGVLPRAGADQQA